MNLDKLDTNVFRGGTLSFNLLGVACSGTIVTIKFSNKNRNTGKLLVYVRQLKSRTDKIIPDEVIGSEVAFRFHISEIETERRGHELIIVTPKYSETCGRIFSCRTKS